MFLYNKFVYFPSVIKIYLISLFVNILVVIDETRNLLCILKNPTR